MKLEGLGKHQNILILISYRKLEVIHSAEILEDIGLFSKAKNRNSI